MPIEKVSFHQVRSHRQKEQAVALISAYLAWLNERVKREYGLDLDIDAMTASDLTDPDKFDPAQGRFYLVHYGSDIAGTGCLKKLEEGVGEVQRMYVPEAFRGRGIGRAIIKRLIEDARTIGYHKLRLESLEFLHEAHALYQSVGFREIDPYAGSGMQSYQSEESLERYYAITVFMEMDL